jgi:hypothetical protein
MKRAHICTKLEEARVRLGRSETETEAKVDPENEERRVDPAGE